MLKYDQNKIIRFFLVVAVVVCGAFFSLPFFGSKTVWVAGVSEATGGGVNTKPVRVVTHVKTPGAVRGLYMTANIAGSKDLRESRLIRLLDDTEANAVIIDIKDYTGRVFIPFSNPDLKSIGSYEKRIPDIENLIDDLHSKNVYVIGRIAVFQDQYMVSVRPDLAVLKEGTDEPWRDYKKIAWLDPGSKEVWKYAADIGKDAYALGFDELNFDYIRFPADGNMDTTSYRFYNSASTTKASQMNSFYEYLHNEFAPAGIPISADLFGMTTTNSDDLGIGQILEHALINFDYVCPMVYPSHYPSGFIGIKNPAAMPYEVVSYSMAKAVEKAKVASTTPLKLRAWLQDFDMGAKYTPELIKAEKQAIYDSGLNSWMMWDPANTYTRGGLLDDK